MRNKRYLRWLAKKVDIDMSQNVDTSYVLLMTAMLDKEFYSVVDMDANRIDDGLGLREEYFGAEMPDDLCSVLEVFVSLALRCESDILGGTASAGNIFWDMLDNTGLDKFTDLQFDTDEVDYILDKILDREYGRNGEGGPFYAGNDFDVDMSKEELWWQMNIYAIRKYEKIELF